MKYHLPIRIWAVLDAPFNYFALPQFFSYDALPILAVMVTGASFIIYSFDLSNIVVKQPGKRSVLVLLWLVIIAGCIRFLSIDILPLGIYACSTFVYGYRDIFEILIWYLPPLFTIYSGIILLKIVGIPCLPRMTNTNLSAATNRMLVVLLAALLWLSAGIVNLVTKLRMVGRVLHSWPDESFVYVVSGVMSYYVAEPLFYILLSILLFAIWKYGHETGGQATPNQLHSDNSHIAIWCSQCVIDC